MDKKKAKVFQREARELGDKIVGGEGVMGNTEQVEFVAEMKDTVAMGDGFLGARDDEDMVGRGRRRS